VIPNIFATDTFPARDQLEAWLEWYRSVCEIIPARPTVDGFQAEVRLWSLGGLAVSRSISPPLQAVRSKRHLRREPIDHWIVSYYARGAHAAHTANASLEVPAGVPYLWSLGQEFAHQRTHGDRIQFIMSRDAFPDLAAVLDAACGSALDTPLGHLLGDYMMGLVRHLPAVAEFDPPRLANAVGTMVAAAVAPSPERVAVAQQQIELGRKERVRQAVRRHLRTPTLGPRTLSRLVGMSRSNLYRLFEDSGGVARYIQNQRLLEAQALLTNAENKKTVAGLAEEFCFADASSFSRAFKREFGCSPGEARSAAVAGTASAAIERRRVPAGRADFGGLLRRF
jgi:AraC-like DNA-binding protein